MEENSVNQNKRFRNHISIILEQTGAVIIAVFVLVVTQLFQSFDEIREADLSFITNRGMLILLAVAALLAVSLISQFLVWAKTYISIEENAIVIEKGRVNKKKNTIGIRNISNINLEQNLIEMLFGTCKVKLDTNSLSTADSTDVKIVLKKSDALWFQQEVMKRMETGAGSESESLEADKSAQAAESRFLELSAGAGTERYDVHADIADILQHGVFSISVISVLIFLIVLVGSIVSAAQILGRADLMASLAGAATGIFVAVFIVLSTLWDTVKDFVRYYNFRAKRRGNKIYIRYGFLKKIDYTIPVDKIQALKIRQSFVARIGHRYMAEIVNVGMGDDQEEQHSFLILYCKKEKLKERLSILLPEYACAVDQPADPLPVSVWGAWAVPAVIAILCMTGGAFLCNELTGNAYCLYVWIALAVVVIMMFTGMVLKYRTQGIGADESYLKLVNGYFSKQYLTVRCRDIQYAMFSQNFIARSCGIKKGEIHLLASSANTTHAVPYFKGSKDEVIKRGMLTF